MSQWNSLYLSLSYLKHESSGAVLVSCSPYSAFASYTFWFPKTLTIRHQVGGYEVIQLQIPDGFEVELTRFQGKALPTLKRHVTRKELLDSFRAEQDLAPLKLQHLARAGFADLEFEREFSKNL